MIVHVVLYNLLIWSCLVSPRLLVVYERSGNPTTSYPNEKAGNPDKVTGFMTVI